MKTKRKAIKKATQTKRKAVDTKQAKFWKGKFSKGYVDRNLLSVEGLNERMRSYFSESEPYSKMIQASLKGVPKNASILEVGCNVGNILTVLQSLGYKNLRGIELNPDVVKAANTLRPALNIKAGNILDILAADGAYDLVYTAGVLIHIAPENIDQALSEIIRVSKKYIWGYEYWSSTYEEIPYRGNRNVLWKTDFAARYRKLAKLSLVYFRKLPLKEKPKCDVIYLLKK